MLFISLFGFALEDPVFEGLLCVAFVLGLVYTGRSCGATGTLSVAFTGAEPEP